MRDYNTFDSIEKAAIVAHVILGVILIVPLFVLLAMVA